MGKSLFFLFLIFNIAFSTRSQAQCAIPSGLTSSYVHYSVFILQWNGVASAIKYQNRARIVGTSTWNVAEGSLTSYIWYNAVPITQYECQVRDSCASGWSDWSTVYNVTTAGVGDPYCYAYGNSALEWIDQVQFGAIGNVSGNNYGYRNYATLSTTVQKGQSYPITLTPDNANANDPVFWRVWIDFNKDNDFFDTGELVLSANGNDQTPLAANIAIPTTASTGTTRMRVMMGTTAINGPCNPGNGFKDAEDYSLNINAGATTLTVSPTVVNAGSSAGGTTVTVSSNCNAWTVSGAPSWLTVSPASGSNNAVVGLAYQQNNGAQARSAVLTFSGCSLTQTVTVTQSGTAPACSTPSGLGSTYVHYSVFFLQCNPVSGGLYYQTRVRPTGASQWAEEDSTNTSPLNHIWYEGISPNTPFECQVRAKCASGWSPWSASYALTTLGAGDPYCYSYGYSTDEWIEAVQFGAINNTSGNNYGYRNYTTLSTTVEQGQSYPITLTPNTDDGPHTVNWRVWVDFNKDNDFLDNGELVISTTGSDQTPLNTNIPIPATASTGVTRMRVMMGFNAINNPCNQAAGYMDTEDYNLTISTAVTTLAVVPSVISVNSSSGSTNFSLTSNCGAWTVSGAPAWLTVTPGSGAGNATVAIAYQQNTSTQARTAVLTISGCALTQTVTVTQSGANVVLTVAPSLINVSASAGSTTFGIASNCAPWTITGLPSWLTVTPVSGSNSATVSIAYQQNTSIQTRTAVLTISGCALTQTVTVTQSGANVSLTVFPTSLSLGSAAGSTSVNLSSNCSAWTITDVPAWLTVTPLSGSNNAAISVIYSQNTSLQSRSAILTISGCSVTQTLTVTQNGATATLKVSPSTLSVTAATGSTSFAVTSNCSAWMVTDIPSWISVSPGNGSNNATVNLTYQQNTSTQARSAVLTISGCNLSQTVTVTQGGANPTLSITPSIVNLGSVAGSTTLGVTSNCSTWTITGAPSWLTLSPASGGNNATVNLTYQQNTSVQARTALLTLSGCSLTQTVTVTQAGANASLTVSPAVIPVGASTGAVSFNITSNCSAWIITGAPSWLTVSSAASGSNATVNLLYQQNTSTQSRTVVLTVTGCGITQTVTVIQAGATSTLTVSPGTLNTTAVAGTASFDISSNCNTWTVNGAPSWLVVSPVSGGNQATISLNYLENTSAQPRTATLTVTGCGITQTVEIVQSGANPVLTVTPPTLNVGSTAGNTSCNIGSNCNTWTITGAPSWLTLSPTSGSNQATVNLAYLENTATQPRSATLTISGCSLSTTLTVTQSGASLNLNVSPSSLNYLAQGGVQQLTLTTSCAWNILNLPTWLTVSPASGSAGTTQITVTAEVNVLPNSQSATLTVSACNGQAVQLIQINREGAANTQPPWTVTPSGDNHTIILPSSLSSNIMGNPLKQGDAVGVFYEFSGTLQCGGYGIWTGETTSFSAYENDATPPAKEGFALGEVFKIKVWRAAQNQVSDATAQYAAIGTSGLVSHTNAYATDGISMITQLSAVNTVQHAVPLANGWNLISSYVVPDAPNMLDVFEDITAQTTILKDGAGASCLPQIAVNNIGDWDVRKGYQVKAASAATLVVEGMKVVPENVSIPLQAGWQIIGYPRDNPQNAATVFNSIQGQIDLVKDNFGKIYVPQYSINTIGELKPGQGYKVKADAAVNLVYAPNFTAPEVKRPSITVEGLVQHFVLDSALNTGNNATIILPLSIATALLQNGR